MRRYEKPLEDLKHMSDFVQMMLSKGIYAFLDQNMDMARELRHDDDKVDDLFDQTLEHVTASMFRDKEAISYLVNLLFIARFLERVGDRAVSIADRTIFMITCENHKPDTHTFYFSSYVFYSVKVLSALH